MLYSYRIIALSQTTNTYLYGLSRWEVLFGLNTFTKTEYQLFGKHSSVRHTRAALIKKKSDFFFSSLLLLRFNLNGKSVCKLLTCKQTSFTLKLKIAHRWKRKTKRFQTEHSKSGYGFFSAVAWVSGFQVVGFDPSCLLRSFWRTASLVMRMLWVCYFAKKP